MVQVKVGPNRSLFRFHKKILCNAALYFEAAFKGGFVEAKDQALLLPDESPVMFKLFELWVYTGNFLAKDESEADISWLSLLDLYIFGEKCGVPDLQNAAIDVLIDKQSSQKIIPTDTLVRIYDNTPEDSSLRRLFVDWMANLVNLIPNDKYASEPAEARCHWFNEESRDKYPKDFLFDLAIAQSQLIFGQNRRIYDFKPRCRHYHVKPREAPSKTSATGQQ